MGMVEELQWPWQADNWIIMHDHDNSSSPILIRHPSSHAHQYSRQGSTSHHTYNNAGSFSPSTLAKGTPRLTTSSSINSSRSRSRSIVGSSTGCLAKNETPYVVFNGFPDERKRRRRRRSNRRQRRGTGEEKGGVINAISPTQLNTAARPAMASFLSRFKISIKTETSHSGSSSRRKAKYRRGSLACTTPHHIAPVCNEYSSRSKSIWPFTTLSSSSSVTAGTNEYTFPQYPQSPPQLSSTQCKVFSLARTGSISISSMINSLKLDSPPYNSRPVDMTSPNYSKSLDKNNSTSQYSIAERKKAPLTGILHRLSSCTSSVSGQDINEPIISSQNKLSRTLKGISTHSIRLPSFLSPKLKRNDTIRKKNVCDSGLTSIDEGNRNNSPTVLPMKGGGSKMGSMVDQIDISDAVSWLNEQYPIKELAKVKEVRRDDLEDILCNGESILPSNGSGIPSSGNSSNEEEYHSDIDSSSDLFELEVLSTIENCLA